MRPVTSRRATVAAMAAALCVITMSAPAHADSDFGQGPATGGPSDQIGSKVSFTMSRPGASGKPLAPVNSDWSPPACWYEPKYTPEELQEYLAGHDYGSGSAGHSDGVKYGEDNFHKGDKGAWYEMVGNLDSDPEGYGECAMARDPYLWVGPDDPPPPGTPVIDPEILAGLAYERTRLPAPPVELSPAADGQVVNLKTYVRFGQDLDRVWVTAQLNQLGVNVAATTVATPVKLHIEAGTPYADPGSCTYTLARKGGGYSVDTKDAECNITYRKSSGDGTYPLKASITWKVTWTDSADPDGPARQPGMPDGESTFEQDVTVREVQSINR